MSKLQIWTFWSAWHLLLLYKFPNRFPSLYLYSARSSDSSCSLEVSGAELQACNNKVKIAPQNYFEIFPWEEKSWNVFHPSSIDSKDFCKVHVGVNCKMPSHSRCLKIAEKVSFNIASEASYVYFLSGQKFIENAKNVPFWRVFENLKLAVKQCYQTCFN